MERLCIFIHIYNKPYISLWPIRSQFDMDLARAPRRARLTARKKGSGYENAPAQKAAECRSILIGSLRSRRYLIGQNVDFEFLIDRSTELE